MIHELEVDGFPVIIDFYRYLNDDRRVDIGEMGEQLYSQMMGWA